MNIPLVYMLSYFLKFKLFLGVLGSVLRGCILERCIGACDLLMVKYTRELYIYLVLFELNEIRVQMELEKERKFSVTKLICFSLF